MDQALLQVNMGHWIDTVKGSLVSLGDLGLHQQTPQKNNNNNKKTHTNM